MMEWNWKYKRTAFPHPKNGAITTCPFWSHHTMLSQQIEAELEELHNSQIPIVVEGREDRKALQYFGLTNILVLYTKPFYKIIEELQKHKEIAVLTDLDKEGKRLYAKINDECSRRGVRVNNSFRHFLLKETELAHIEGLPRYVERLREKETDKRHKSWNKKKLYKNTQPKKTNKKY